MQLTAKDPNKPEYGEEDFEELESQTASNRAAPLAIAVASVLVVAGILAAWFFVISPARRDAPKPAAESGQGESVVQKSAAARPPAKPAGVQQPADNRSAAGGEEAATQNAAKMPVNKAAAEAASAPDAPSFDTVRVESSGDAVLAGQAKPGANVTLYAGAEKIGEALADAGGNWAMVLDKPLPAGTSDLWISAAGEGMDEARSRQSLAVVIDPNRRARPLVVVQDDEGGSRVLQQPEQEMAEARAGTTAGTGKEDGGGANAAAPDGPAAGRAPVVIETADYADTGELSISGSAAPNATVRLYYDDTHAGDALADDKGRWSLSLKRDLDGAVHSVRADGLESGSGKVGARAEVSFIAKLSPEQERELSQRIAERAKADGASQVASLEPNGENGGAAVASGAAGVESEKPSDGQTASATSGGEGEATAATGRGRITIERGDNLWRIAREHYGHGIRYTAIFQANKEQIRNPNLIYPGQVFLIPGLQDTN